MIVLIVEDQESVSRLYETFVRSLAKEVRLAENLKDALDLMANVPHPDLVLLDLRLPDSDYMETLKSIQTFRGINPEVVVLVVSGLSHAEIDRLAIEAGADGFSEKAQISTQTKLFRSIFDTLDRRIKSGVPAFKASGDLLQLLAQVTNPLPQ